MASIAVIGSGISGLSTAAYLAKQGHKVCVYEKNSTPGGRARSFTREGYVFDMGPSWYWMPGVFEKFFNDFNYKVSDLYDLQLLDPAFEIVYRNNTPMSIAADYAALRQQFESIEPGSADRLDIFMKEAKYKYDISMDNLIYKPGLSISEFADPGLIKNMLRLSVFSSFSDHVYNHFKDPRLRALMEFPVLFLGAMPSKTPALYSMMNYAGLKLGTWYPKGGFGKVIDAMMRVGMEQGVNFSFDTPVEKIILVNKKVTGIQINDRFIRCDAVVAAADYHHIESQLLPTEMKNYTEAYWSKKTFAPSCLIFYVGMKKKISRLQHHTLFFDEDLLQHSKDIYEDPRWPDNPLFYVCCPSKTDRSVAPEGHENLFFLMPVAPGLEDTPERREKYFHIMLTRLQQFTGEDDLSAYIDYKRSYCIADFIEDYNAYKGNAYGLANTLTQTAVMKPKIINKKIKNLFYAGQLTVPGPGVPPALISGKIASQQLQKYFKTKRHEAVI